MKDYVVIIGRFQPVHNGHVSLINKAFEQANKGVIVLVGSSYSPRNIKNPFTFEERRDMLEREFALVGKCMKTFTVVPLQDHTYRDAEWITQVQEKVAFAVNRQGWTDFPPTVGLMGLDKDHTTSYLNWFPQWRMPDMMHEEDLNGLNATSIRDIIFGVGKPISFIRGVVPSSTYDFLLELKSEPFWQNLCAEHAFVAAYKSSWASAPYAPTFVTVDAVVIQDGHVLMVERGANPGKGLLALPGGFVNANELLKDAVIRELREETRLKVAPNQLKGSIIAREIFDAPDRSLRGRTITQATLFNLASTADGLAKVKGGDDAAKAMWIPLSALDRSKIFEDHFHIIQKMTSLL